MAVAQEARTVAAARVRAEVFFRERFFIGVLRELKVVQGNWLFFKLPKLFGKKRYYQRFFLGGSSNFTRST